MDAGNYDPNEEQPKGIQAREREWKDTADMNQTYQDHHQVCPGLYADSAAAGTNKHDSSSVNQSAENPGKHSSIPHGVSRESSESHHRHDVSSSIKDTPASQDPGRETCQIKHPENMQQVIFHVYLDYDADNVSVLFETHVASRSDLTLELRHVDDNHKYWTSTPILVSPDEYDAVRYLYFVKYHRGIAGRVFASVKRAFGYNPDRVIEETYFRNLYPSINQYDIFKPAGNCSVETFFERQFFFYKKISSSGVNLKELMIECEHVDFGHHSYICENNLRTFRTWIEELTSGGVTPYQSAFLCALLGQFRKEDFNRSRTIAAFFEERTKTVDILLRKLRLCPRKYFPGTSLDFIRLIDWELQMASSNPHCLGYILNFCHLYDSKTVLDTAILFDMVSTEKIFNDFAKDIVLQSLQVGNKGDMINVSVFLVKASPSIDSLWKLYRNFDYQASDLITLLDDAVVDMFKEFFSRSQKPDVLDTKVWKKAPSALKPKLAVPFCGSLMKQVKQEALLTKKKLSNVKYFMLDKDLQRSAALGIVNLLKWLTASKPEASLRAACAILQARKFYSFWKDMKDEDKEVVSRDLLHSKIGANCRQTSTGSKDKVVIAFRSLQEVCQIPVLKSDEKLVTFLVETVFHDTKDLGLKAIVDAYEEINTSLGRSARTWHMELLRSTMEVDSARGHSLSHSLIDIIRSMGNNQTTRTMQKCPIDSVREEILLILLNETKLPKPQCLNEDGAKNVLEAVLLEKDMWRLALEATGSVNRLCKNPNHVLVRETLHWLAQATIERNLRVDFFNDFDVKEVVKLLALSGCDPGSTGSSNSSLEYRWQHCLTSFSRERDALYEVFDTLKDVFTLAHNCTSAKGILKLDDLDVILGQWNSRRKTLNGTVVSDLHSEKYWGPLKSLLEPAKELNCYCSSTLFLNVAVKCVKALQQKKQNLEEGQIEYESEGIFVEMDEEKEEDQDTTGKVATATVEEVLQLLSSQGIPEFRNTCGRFFKTDGEIAVTELDTLFYGVKKEDLEKELQLICTLLGHGDFPVTVKWMLKNYLYPEVQNKIQKLISALDKLGYTAACESPMLKSLISFVKCTKTPTTLKSVSEAINQKIITDVDKKLDSDLTDILTELAEARELIDFITMTANDDMANLVDAVEEHSDQLIQESTVSDLIDVHRFLSGLLKNKPDDPSNFFTDLVKTYKALDESRKTGNSLKNKMAAKIKLCSSNVHSLRGLYMSLANRGEMTKEIIGNAVKNGCYQVKITPNKSCQVLLTYDRKYSNGTKASYGMADLHDLRSRALLIVNSDKTKVCESLDKERAIVTADELSAFIQQVDLITEIIRKYEVLRKSGLPKYQKCWRKLKTSEEIKDLERILNKELDLWNTILHNVRMKYFYLNYFHANQLWTLKKFFREHNNLEEEDRCVAFGMFRSIDPRIQLGDLPFFVSKYQRPTKDETESELHAIGKALEEIFKSKKHAKHPLISTKQIDATVEPGKLFVAVLEPKSAQTVHVIMSLFQNTSASLPEPSQVLFCHSGTTWEEIALLLRRTFEAHGHGYTSKLHCLANVECLPNDIQFELVDTIKKCQSSNEATYRLALVCRGGAHHHIVDQFSDFAHHSGGMADAELRDKFAEARPDVLLITTDLPGLGKTEVIHDHAAAKRKSVVTFPISGPLSRRTLVRRLLSLKLNRFQAIHFEIGEVDDPLALDTFLFELIIIGMVLSGTELFHLPSKHIYVEVANTLQHWMRDSLPVTKCFKRLWKKWENYKDLVISQEVTSPIQVVCHYLQAYERGTLESEEVIFSGSNKLKPLSFKICRSLLLKHFATGGDPSFNILENFLSVLADQLLKFTRSQFFKPHNLEAMVGKSHDVRVRLFKALLEVATSFAARSVNTCKAIQAEALNEEQAIEALKKMQSEVGATADQMISRVNEMIQWADNESIVIVFHGLGSITAIYRDVDKVPQGVKDLFKSQAIKGKGQGLEDYKAMSQTELQIRLERISDASQKPSGDALSMMGYALTPDNILKMALITQRMQANIPVIVMGETGCGKTTLVRYLAATRNTPFHVFNFHAGITEEQIIEFVMLKDKEARQLQREGKAVWVFLDEINTCDYLGTVNEIICHRSVHGTPLASNLVFVAACNPYRLRPPCKVMTAGLSGKTTTDEYSKLVYRVHPLPETMIDYVWDYGSLTPEDERAYISRMVEGVLENKYQELLVALLATSQDFVRETEGSSYCVSLRDVHRTIILIKWFHKTLSNRPSISNTNIPDHVRRYFQTAKLFSLDERSIVLSLAHCYLSRLPTTTLRDEYCNKMTSIFTAHKLPMFVDQKTQHEDYLQEIIRAEQEDYLLRMELPEGTACNAALRENVFVILVCIMNRIPVFVVGKPGCSKSLSMQVIRSNLRGQDSKDPFLKTLPQLFVVSYQGSESSTSEGIEKVFEKARKYKEKAHNVLPVVLLDEIGLAEVSKFNPLKVLHRLLEPGKGEFPDVAVVGISNWALDAAKMNRAIHLSRPEPDENDLYETGLSIRQAQINKVEGAKGSRSGKDNGKSSITDQQLKNLAEAYYQYQSSQKHENFHGLRDYYSLVKCLKATTRDKGRRGEIQRALQRNFGGLTRGASNIQQLFLEKFEKYQVAAEESREYPVTDLIRDNLHDKLARHLMLLTNSDSAIGILDQTLDCLNKENITMFGSHFEEDLSADYNYRVLSRIILCMEQDCVLILRDLENIYGSLYDMLNQNYIVVGGKKNCRIALGAFSNPMCQVHDGFRCIVLIDQSKVDYTDPPFLNRFEKQQLRFSDVLNAEQQETIKELRDWVESISTLEEFGTEFDETDMFAGFHDDTLPSLVLNYSQDSDLSRKDVLKRCKKDLMAIASPDAVLRSLKSNLHYSNKEEVKHLYNEYFQRPVHQGLEHFLRYSFIGSDPLEDDSCGMRILVMTHSNIYTNVSRALAGLLEVQTEKLSSFKSEKQLSKRIHHFWVESSASLLVLQCQPDHDSSHMLLAKSIIEQQRTEFHKSSVSGSGVGPKHVCILIHLQRERSNEDEKYDSRWQFNFLSGWKQVMVDVLERQVVPITDLLEVSVLEVLHSHSHPFEKVAADQLLWCFTRIKYPPSRQPSLEKTMALADCLSESQTIMECFKQLCCQWISRKQEHSNSPTPGILESWQVSVACDRQALVNCATLVRALEHFVNHLVRQPLAKIIYFMENESAWSTCLHGGNDELRTLTELMLNEQVFNIDQIPDPQGAESLVTRGTSVVLKYPFASMFCKRIEGLSNFFMEEFRRQHLNESNLDKNRELTPNARESLMKRVSSVLEQRVPEIIESEYLSSNIENYVEDVLDMKSEEFSDALSRSQRVSLLKASLSDFMSTSDVKNDSKAVALVLARLHSTFWIAENSVVPILQFVSTCHAIAPVELCEIITTFYCMAEKEKSKNQDKQGAPIEVVNDILDECDVIETSSKVESIEELQGNYLPHSMEAGEVLTTVEEKAACAVTKGMANEPKDGADGKIENKKTKIACDPVCEIEGKHGEVGDESLTLELPTNVSTFTADISQRPVCKGLKEQETLKESMEDDFDVVVGGETNKREDDNSKLKQTASEVMLGSGNHEVEELSADQRQTDSLQESCQTFDEYLVQAFCSAMIPTEELVSIMGGPDKWGSAASLILSMASRMPSRDPVFYYLRVCYDFTSLVLLPESLKPCFLYLFGELGKQVAEEDYLDSTRCFETFCEMIEDLRGEVKDEGLLNEFLYLFFARCIDSNPDTPSLGGILMQTSSSGDERLLRLACPIVFQVLLSEEAAFTSENFGKILVSASNFDDFPNLLRIKEVLSPIEKENAEELHPHFVVMCCDLINEVAFKDLSVKGLSGSDSPVLKNLHRAMDVLTDTTKDNDRGLFYVVCAIAYVRALMKAFASFLQDHPSALSTDGEYSMFVNEISGALIQGYSTETTTQVCCFLLKELRNKLSMSEVQRICEQSEKLPVLGALKWQERQSSAKLSLDPFLKLQERSEAERALGTLFAFGNPQPMQKVLCSLDSSQKRMELVAVLMKAFYLTRSIRNIKDTEDAAAVILKENIKNVSKPYVEFILRITNQNKFGSPKLDISPESSPKDVQIATLMLHLTAILTSSYSDKNPSALMCCLTDPARLSTSHIFAAPENANSGFGIYTNFDAVSHPRLSHLHCPSGTKLVVLIEALDLVCPNCKRAFDVYHLQHEDPGEPPKAACAVGYLLCDPQEMLDDLICVRKLSPAEFRILHLAVHCALFMGHAMKLTDDNTLAKFLSPEKKIDDPSGLCFYHVRHDLNALCKLFDCREELVINLLHSVFESTTSLLTEDLKMALPHDQTARCSWEKKFATIVSPLIEKFQHNEIKPSLRGQNNVQVLEDQIDEVGEPHYSDLDTRNMYLPRLFRKTKPKSFTGLRSYYINSPADIKEKHQLLGLFLDYHDKLPLARNLVGLNTWSRLVDFLLSRRLTRGEAKGKKIADAIIRREQQSMQNCPRNVNRENLKKMFEDFRKAWKKILPYVRKHLEDGDAMPYISEMECVGYCLVETRGLGRYLASALTFLARIQNEFLDKVLAIAATGNCPALNFLRKGDSISGLPMVHVQDARDKEIVQYEWTDLFLEHSQHNTEYGHGTEIIYDLGKIEKDMAVEFIIGKCYLTLSEGLREFVFSKELFHDCADILNELHLTVPQEQLPNDVETGLSSLATQSLGNIQSLLESMEIVLCFLKRTGGKTDDSLVDYIDSWISASQHFSKELLPEPQNTIKLKHVAALYESLEDKLSGSATECVTDEYREPLSDDEKRQIDENDLLKSKQGKQVLLEAAVVALTRFIFRYLSLKPEPGGALVECMADISLWPIGLVGDTKSSTFQVSVVSQLIPKMLTIGHVHSVLSRYQHLLEDLLQSRLTMPGGPRPEISRETGKRSRTKKRRAAIGFGHS